MKAEVLRAPGLAVINKLIAPVKHERGQVMRRKKYAAQRLL